MNVPAIAVHGGAGIISSSSQNADIEKPYFNALRQALDCGFNRLKHNGSALEAVTQAVCILEDCELFNAGKGSVFTAKGEHEMDASIMEGRALRAGAVAGTRGIKNPVLLAKSVLQNTRYVFLAGEGAMEWARQEGLKFETDSYFFTQQRYDEWKQLKASGEVKLDHSSGKEQPFGTVGAVAVDEAGNVATATSTGGMTNKSLGRIGDSPVIGAGTYANNRTCAVSCTGHGEYFIRGVAAYDVSCLMEFKNLSLEQAAKEVIHKRIKKLGGEGGLIAVDSDGNISMPFNTEGMYRGMKNDRKTFTKIH